MLIYSAMLEELLAHIQEVCTGLPVSSLFAYLISTLSLCQALFIFTGTDEIDFTRYPDKPYQLDWLRYYLQCKTEQNGGSADDVTERDVEECYVKTNKFALVSCICPVG